MEIENLYKIFLQHPVITTDSRDVPAGSIFFALKGDNFDGNKYAVSAIEKGAAYAVVDDATISHERCIHTDDVLTTLQQLANYHRRQLGTTIVGVTGTNGKTTTKELIAAVLQKKFRTLYTQGNFNNHIGVPKTLLQLTSDHEIAVVEMGANHPGEIKTLVNIVEPNYGIITNVGKAHLLGFGSFEGVIKTKGELYDFLRTKQDSAAFINADNQYLMGISDGLNLIKYSSTGRMESCNPFLRFNYETADGIHSVQTQLIGSYNIDNAMAAVTIGLHFGVAPSDIDKALTDYTPSNNRSQFRQTEANRLIIDAYNANPTSMTAALKNFAQMQTENKMCILGDMKELGEVSQEEHKRIINLIIESGFSTVWLVGEEFEKAAATADTASISISLFKNVDEVNAAIAANKPHDCTILVKGSNSTRLIQIVDNL